MMHAWTSKTSKGEGRKAKHHAFSSDIERTHPPRVYEVFIYVSKNICCAKSLNAQKSTPEYCCVVRSDSWEPQSLYIHPFAYII